MESQQSSLRKNVFNGIPLTCTGRVNFSSSRFHQKGLNTLAEIGSLAQSDSRTTLYLSDNPIPSQATERQAETLMCIFCAKLSVQPSKKPQRSCSFLKEKHTDSMGIRKTLRQGRGGEVLLPLHITLHRNSQPTEYTVT